jgi:hypothetical protein
VNIAFSTIVGAGTLLNIRPRDTGIFVLGVMLFSAAEFIALPFGDGRGIRLYCKTIPKVLDKLEAFGPTQVKNLCEFGSHEIIISGSTAQFNNVRWRIFNRITRMGFPSDQIFSADCREIYPWA